VQDVSLSEQVSSLDSTTYLQAKSTKQLNIKACQDPADVLFTLITATQHELCKYTAEL